MQLDEPGDDLLVAQWPKSRWSQELLHRRYQELGRQIGAKLHLDQADADEVFDTALMAAVGSYDSGRGTTFKTYLYGICIKKAMTRWSRTNKYAPPVDTGAWMQQLPGARAPVRPSVKTLQATARAELPEWEVSSATGGPTDWRSRSEHDDMAALLATSVLQAWDEVQRDQGKAAAAAHFLLEQQFVPPRVLSEARTIYADLGLPLTAKGRDLAMRLGLSDAAVTSRRGSFRDRIRTIYLQLISDGEDL